MRVIGRDAVIAHIPRAALVGQFRQGGLQPFNPGRVNHQRGQIWVRKITIIMRVFLGSHGTRDPAARIKQPRFLINRAAGFPHLNLPARFGFHRLHDKADGIHILHFAARAKTLSGLADGDIHIGPHGAFIHIAIASAQIAHDLAQLGEVSAGFLGAPHIGFRDNFHQRHTGTVQVNEGFCRVLVMLGFTGILFQMQPRDADGLCAAIGQFNINRAFADDGMGVLADLITLRQIGIEVILPIKARPEIDLGIQA